MKKNVSKSNRKSSKHLRLAGLENLEDRRVLAANVLANGVGAISAGTIQDVTMTVTAADAPAGTEVALGIDISADTGSNLDPSAITVLDSTGANVATTFSDANANGTASRATLSVPAGVYTLQIAGENATSGDFAIDVSLIGDVDAPTNSAAAGSVSTAELKAAQFSFSQTLSAGNFVTDHFNNVFGFGSGGSIESGFDANGNGEIDASDLAAIRGNQAAGQVSIDLEVDGSGPEFNNTRLVTDTGVSATDGITTSPDLLVDVSDSSQITSVTAAINGGSPINIAGLVGDFNATGSFLLDNSDLTAINGGTALANGPVSIVFEGIDELGNASTSTAFTYTFLGTNLSPTTSGVADQTTNEDAAYSFNISSAFSDPNTGDVLTFSAAGLPAWLTFNADSGLLSGTPANSDVGSSTVTLTATDTQGVSVNDSFVLTVANVNDAPTLSTTIGSQNASEDVAFSLNLNSFFSDPDGDAITYAVVQGTGFDSSGNVINGTALPGWLTESGGVLSGTPTDGDAGSISVAVIGVDPAGETANALFTINVGGQNDAPTLVSAIPDQNLQEDAAVNLDLNSFFADADPGDTLTITAILPTSLSINGGVITGTLDNADVGTNTVTVTATDAAGAAISDTFELTVTNVNDAPSIGNRGFTLDPASLVNGLSVGNLPASDVDVGDSLTFSITSGDATGLYSIDSATGEISVANAAGIQAGSTQTLTVQAQDIAGATSLGTATITVSAGAATVEYRLEVQDASGAVVTSVAPGSDFTLVAFTEDVRAIPEGVFASYLDVTYVGADITPSGAIVHSSFFSQSTNGTNTDPGLLDEVGGFTGNLTPPGGGPQEVFRQTFTAGSTAGAVTFSSDEPESQSQRGTLIFGANNTIPVSDISFGSTVVTIGTPAAAAGIVVNPHDVNGDGFVSPMDALIVINQLNGTSSAGVFSVDVNGDGALSPIDALLVINNLLLGDSTGSDVLVGGNSDVSQSDLANALEFVFEELASDLDSDPVATATMLTELESPLIESIFDVIEADDTDQEAMWDVLADDLAALLANG